MKLNLKSIDPYEWRLLVSEEENRETLVKSFKSNSLVDVTKAVTIITKVAVDQKLEDQVQFSADAKRLIVFIHYMDDGQIQEPHRKLANAIDYALELD